MASGSGWMLWVWLAGGECGCNTFPHTTYPYSSCICSFWQQHHYFFVHFSFLFLSCFVIYVIFCAV